MAKDKAKETSEGALRYVELDGVNYVILREAAYQELADEAEAGEAIARYDRTKRALETGEAELVPFDSLTRVLEGDNPIRVWRQYRGLTQAELAERTGIDRSHVSKLEAARTVGNVATLRKIAAVLDVTIDDLVAIPGEDDDLPE